VLQHPKYVNIKTVKETFFKGASMCENVKKIERILFHCLLFQFLKELVNTAHHEHKMYEYHFASYLSVYSSFLILESPFSDPLMPKI
jgi:hypothetical protein